MNKSAAPQVLYATEFRVPLWIFVIIGLIYCLAIPVDVMDVDAAQYAEMSRELMHQTNWLHLFDRGKDYLDKPPLLFWITALSMKLFGANNFAYKLPTILSAYWAIYATYRLTRILYNESLARLSALLLASCQGLFLWTNDVRTDMLLMSCVITAIWCIRASEDKRKWYFILGGAVAIAFGMMTKGPIALLVPAFAIGSDSLLRKGWKKLVTPWGLLYMAIIGVLLLPMCIGLYQQFDAHPEKVIDGHTGVSGLKFFFWTQSFGRITGSNEWSNGAGPFFLLGSMFWAFLPWIFLLIPALFQNLKQLIQQRLKLSNKQEWISTGGFLLSYLSLCFSNYQLPHYILVAFPFAAIVSAKMLYDLFTDKKYVPTARFFSSFYVPVCLLLQLGVALLYIYIFPAHNLQLVCFIGAQLVWLGLLLKINGMKRLLWLPVGTMLIINLVLSTHFYPKLLQYQAGSVFGRYLNEARIDPNKVIIWLMPDPMVSLHFYAKGVVTEINHYPAPGQSGDYVITTSSQLNSYDSSHAKYDVLKSGNFFIVSELNLDFINPETRNSTLKSYSLIRLK